MSDLISRQEALNIRFNDAINEDGVLYVPLRDFSKGLKALPSAQPELIEKAAYIRGFEQGRTQGMIDTKAEGVAQPTADMVEVVRCKDCKFYTFKPQQTSRTTSVRRCNRSAIVCTKPDDFCSFGERADE